MKRCDYCNMPTSAEECPNCGSRSFDSKPVSQIHESQPFYYNGYVIWWCCAEWGFDTAEYLFYLGDRLVERFTVTREFLRAFVPEACSATGFIWDLFLIAQGEEEVLQVVEQNTIKPAVFEITRKPSSEEKYALGLSMQDVHKAIAQGERRLGC